MKIMINKLTLLLLCTLVLSINHVQANVLQQSITITGKVTDEFGESVPSATIMVKGTSVGVVSDINGQYSINVPNRDAVLVFSHWFYYTRGCCWESAEINVTFSDDLMVSKKW